jgi:hypothetical protein
MVPNIIQPLLQLLSRKKGDLDGFLGDVSGVVHVGANIGQERQLYAAHKLNVLWIEPISEVFKRLESNI